MSPYCVALGGGHGLSATLRALRLYADPIVGIVSVADDGGSSGLLRQAYGIAPPGDLRKCLVALGDPLSPWAQAFEHRFAGPVLGSDALPKSLEISLAGVEGHALGNLIIAGLAEVMGSLQNALDEAGKLVNAVGRVLPATEVPVVLHAQSPGRKIRGQVAVSSAGRLASVSVFPPDPATSAEVLRSIAEADQVILGPGSLFTSVLATVVVPSIADALKTTPARKIYVCNLATQIPETSGYDVADHLAAMAKHGVDVDTVVCDTSAISLGDIDGVTVVEAPLADPTGREHDPVKLAAVLVDLI